MAVPVASLAAIFMGSGWFTSSERSRETDYQKSADERFERFHLDILSGDLSDVCSEGRCETHRSAHHSQHFFDFGVVTAGAQDDRHA
jgi:hypothetical protein